MSNINRSHLYYMVEIDIKGFFDHVDHSKLIRQMWTMGIQDRQLLCVIRKILQAKILMPDGTVITPTEGTPQGGIISPLLAKYFIEYHVLRMQNGDRWHYTDFLFVRDNGEPMHPDSITAWLREFSKRHDLPHINPHAFRHTMASVLINSGKDIVSVSKRLGHANRSTTANIYAHIMAQADEQASECLADVMLRSEIE